MADGCLRDTPRIPGPGLGVWSRGRTPDFHTQTGLMPFAVDVPVACGETLVMPGDIIVADNDGDDGGVVVPIALAERLLSEGNPHAEWEDFSRFKLSQGGDLRKYYPLSPEAEDENREWCKANPA